MRTVAIIGSHPATRELYDWERDDCDVWVFNEAMKEKWIQRADAVFQMHTPTIWRSTANRNDKNHYQWLQKQDNPTIWMQDEYQDVPKAERYPLEEVLALAPRFGYFTSSVAYAIALAIHKEYDRIELYGAEMETNTEYGHQRQGVAFWLGVAVGRGIDTEHFSPKFWKAPLYGYEGNAKIDIKHYEQRIEILQKGREQAAKEHERIVNDVQILLKSFIKTYKTDLSQLDKAIVASGQSAHNFGMIDGAMQTCEKYRAKCQTMLDETDDYLIVRQEYEGQMHAGMKNKTEEFNRVHVHADRLETARKKMNTNANAEIRQRLVDEFVKHYDKYIEKSTMTGVANGVFMENRELLMHYDRLLNANGANPVEVTADA